MVDSTLLRLHQAAWRAGLPPLFGGIAFELEDVKALEACGEGESHEVRFSNASGPVGNLIVDLHDSGDPEDEGLTVGLRGWTLNEEVASA